jgi:hypothetical protein
MAAVALPTLPKATISSPPKRLIAAAMRRYATPIASCSHLLHRSHYAISSKTYVSFVGYVLYVAKSG